jgi:CII-binding regulator of phage lambda lysogenization HflD
MRITTAQRTANENRIRAAMDRLLRGDIPSGGRCDIKTLARTAGVDRTAFYGDRPYAHLRAEFEQRLHDLQQTGDRPDQRDAQITRIKDEIISLKGRLTQSADTINELTDFRTQAIARLAAQHDEITRLRNSAEAASQLPRLPRPATITTPAQLN